MKLYEVKDVVREHVGRDRVNEVILDFCLQRGLRELEKRENWYWMEASQVFDIHEDQQEYSIANDLQIDDYKDADLLLVSDRSQTNPAWCEVVGPEMISSTKSNFAETDSATPAFWSLREENDDPTIILWPPNPDQDYRGDFHYFHWTALPADSKSSNHEVLRRWPEALIYLATEQAILVATKDVEQATFWRLQFDNPADQHMGSELKKMKLYQQERRTRKRFNSSSSNAGTTLGSQARISQGGWF